MELLPCPFCGSDLTMKNFNNESRYCKCLRCGSEADIHIWNTRHTPWISVKDSLPEEEGWYLCSIKNYGRPYPLLYYKNMLDAVPMFYGSFGDYTRQDVTHWMPLPPLPEVNS